MSSVTYAFSTGNTISASEVNQNFADVVSLATAISAGQILGGITSDKLASKYDVAHDTVPIVPFGAAYDLDGSSNPLNSMAADGSTVPTTAYFRFPAAMATHSDWFPVLNTGFKGYLTSIRVYLAKQNAVTGTYPAIQFLLNNAITLGGAAITLDTDASTYLISSDVNPISQPLCALTDGDYIRIQIGNSDGSADQPFALGLSVTFTYKYELQQ